MTTVFFITNRRPDNRRKPTTFNGEFAQEGASFIRFGSAEISPGGTATIAVAPEDLDTGLLGSQTVFDHLRETMVRDGCDTVGLVHGFNTDFEQSLRNGAALKAKLGRLLGGVNVVVFSWPSDGRMIPGMSYISDRDDAENSKVAMARAMLKLRAFLGEVQKRDIACRQRIHLVFHSMGNWVFENAVQHLTKRFWLTPIQLADSIFLMAADVDDTALEYPDKLEPATRMAKRGLHVYFNAEDRALAVSDLTKANPNRLGQSGPAHPWALPARVNLIDCGGVVDGLTEHDYYKENDAVLADMAAVMNGAAADEIEGRAYSARTNTYRLMGG